MWLVWAVNQYYLTGDDLVFQFLTFWVKIRLFLAGRVTVEVSHYDPFFPWVAWRWNIFGGGEYRL